MRKKFENLFCDGNGRSIYNGTATVYLAGTTTLATIYSSATASSAVTGSVVTTGIDGGYSFYVDAFDYDDAQKFKIVLSKTGYTTAEYDNVAVDTVVLGSYTVSTARTCAASIRIPNGVLFVKSGSGTIAFTGPTEIGNYQVFSGFAAGNVTFGAGTVDHARPEWWATNTTPGTTDMAAAIQAAHDSVAAGTADVLLTGSQYGISGTITTTKASLKTVSENNRRTTIKALAGFTGTWMIETSNVAGVEEAGVYNLTLDGNGKLASGLLIKHYKQMVKKVYVTDADIGIGLGDGTGTAWQADVYDIEANACNTGLKINSNGAAFNIYSPHLAGNANYGLHLVYGTVINIFGGAIQASGVNNIRMDSFGTVSETFNVYGTVFEDTTADLDCVYINRNTKSVGPINFIGCKFVGKSTSTAGHCFRKDSTSKLNVQGCRISYYPYIIDSIDSLGGSFTDNVISNLTTFWDTRTGLDPVSGLPSWRLEGNSGYASEIYGTATIAGGASDSGDIAHGLIDKPSVVEILEVTQSGAGTDWGGVQLIVRSDTNIKFGIPSAAAGGKDITIVYRAKLGSM